MVTNRYKMMNDKIVNKFGVKILTQLFWSRWKNIFYRPVSKFKIELIY